MAGTMGIDQNGTCWHELGKNPRAELLRRLDRKSARKFYRDSKDGGCRHVGYIVSGLWIELFTVCPWDSPGQKTAGGE